LALWVWKLKERNLEVGNALLKHALVFFLRGKKIWKIGSIDTIEILPPFMLGLNGGVGGRKVIRNTIQP
jgi:hypothetical protein